MKKIGMLAAICLLSLAVLVGCAGKAQSGSGSADAKSERWDLPALNGNYAYLCVEVLSKDYEAKTAEVKVVEFDSAGKVKLGEVPVDAEGTIDCSDLIVFMGIKDGSHWMISYLDANQTGFPIQIYSLENMDDFAERMAQEDAPTSAS